MKTKEEYLKEVRNISEEYFRKGEFFALKQFSRQ